MELEFLGGAYEGRSPDVDAQECQNLFLEIDQVGGKKAALVGTPGLVEFCDLGTNEEVRGLITMGGTLYAISGDDLFSVDSSGSATTLDAACITGSATGAISMAHNSTDILIADGTYGYLYQPATGNCLEIAANHDADFPGAKYVTFQDGYFIVIEPSSGKFYISASYDGTDWTATDYATAERHPDDALACLSAHGNLWIFGEESTEVFYNSGASFPFEVVEGAFIKAGIECKDTLAVAGNTVFWLDNFRKVRMAVGFQGEVVSTPQIEYRLAQLTTTSDAKGMALTHEGATFYVLAFPSENKTWGFCLETRQWFRLASYPLVTSINEHGRHRMNCAVRFAGKNLVGDYLNGKIYYLDSGTYTDDGNTIRRKRIGQTISSETRKNLFYTSIELVLEAGVGLSATREIWNCATSYVSGDVVTYQRLYSGTHDGSANAAALSDSSASWEINELVGMRVNNTTDGSSGHVTANTATTVTATLAGGTDDDWDVSDAYTISDDQGHIYKCSATSSNNEPPNSSYWDAYEGADPKVMLSWSDDRGHTWSNEHWASIGMKGNYGKTATWRKLGYSKNRTFQILVTEPIKCIVLGLYGDIEEGY